MCRRFSLPVEDWTDILEVYGIINKDFTHPPVITLQRINLCLRLYLMDNHGKSVC